MARKKPARHAERDTAELSKNDGPREEETALAIKRELASELHRAMKKQKMSQSSSHVACAPVAPSFIGC